MTDPVESKRNARDVDFYSKWDPPAPSPGDDRRRADARHADAIDDLPWHPPACGYGNLEAVAACSTGPVDGATLFIKGKGDVDEIDPNDVKQNQLGDCYLFAAAMSLAKTAEGRQRIHDMIREKTVNGKTVYEVTFREPISQASTPEGFRSPSFREVTVQVPADELIQGHAAVGDREGSRKEIWPLVLEAGYAQYKKGYQNVANGGYPADAFTAMSGRPAAQLTMPSYDDVQLKKDFAAHKPIVMWFQLPKPPGNAPAPKTIPEYGVYAGHAYSVKNVFQKNGETYVQLENPWGHDDPKPIPLRVLQRVNTHVETD